MASKQKVVCAILIGIVYTCSLATASYGAQEKPISVVFKGKVVCDACSSDEMSFSDSSNIISGAVVAVECNRGLNRKTSAGQLVSIEGETDENGEFKVELPGSIISSNLLSSSADHNSILKGYCSARLLSSPLEKCNVPFPVFSSSDQLTLTSDCHGILTFTFPSLSYRSQSKLCSHSDITGLSDHEALRSGRVLLHEVSERSSSGMDVSFPHANFPPLPKPELGLGSPPLQLPHPYPVSGFPPIHLPHPTPVSGFPPLHLPHPPPVSGLSPLHLPHPNPVSGFPPLHFPHPPPVSGLSPLHLPHPPPVSGLAPLHLPHPPPVSGLPPPVSGLPPLHVPHPRPVSGFPPLHLPHPRPVSSFPPLHLPHPQLSFPPLPSSFPPLPSGVPIAGPSILH